MVDGAGHTHMPVSIYPAHQEAFSEFKDTSWRSRSAQGGYEVELGWGVDWGQSQGQDPEAWRDTSSL